MKASARRTIGAEKFFVKSWRHCRARGQATPSLLSVRWHRVKICRELLKPDGYLVFTEAVWLTGNPAALVKAAFADYPAMGDIDNVLWCLEQTGFDVVGHFVLPEAAWWDDFYTPMLAEIDRQRGKFAADPDALAILEEIVKEPKMRRKHRGDFGYGCFVARKA